METRECGPAYWEIIGNARIINPPKSASLNQKKRMGKCNSNTSVFVWILLILFNLFKDQNESEISMPKIITKNPH